MTRDSIKEKKMGDMTSTHPDRQKDNREMLKMVTALLAMNFGPLLLIYLIK